MLSCKCISQWQTTKFSMPLAIALNHDKMLHLTSKRIMRFAKLQLLSFCSFYVCASTVQIFIRLTEWLVLLCVLNCSVPFTLLYLHLQCTMSTLIQFNNSQRHERNYYTGISLLKFITMYASDSLGKNINKTACIKRLIEKSFAGMRSWN